VRHLKADGELNTRQLAERVMCERNLDTADTALRNSVVFKVVQALRHAAKEASTYETSAFTGWAV
jgi:hypothetical protein